MEKVSFSGSKARFQFRAVMNNREVEHGVYGKRQTAKMKLVSSLIRCVYSRVKLFVFAMNSRRRYSIFVCFIYGLEEKNSKSEVIFAVCRLPLTSCLTSLTSARASCTRKLLRLFRKEKLCKKTLYSGIELICEFPKQCLIITKPCFL